MSLSKSQKKHLYGENTQAPVKERRTAQPSPTRSVRQESRVASEPLRFADASRADMQPEPAKNSSFIFAGVAFVIALLFFAYYHFLILPQISALAGTQVPELSFWFTSDQLYAFQQGLGVENIQQYQVLHRSTGLIFPLIFAAAWLGMISASKYSLVSARLMMLLPCLYAVIFIAGGFMVDAVVANPNGPVGLAALLIAARWILFILCLLQLVLMAVRLVRGKVNDFAEGKLPGQQPLK